LYFGAFMRQSSPPSGIFADRFGLTDGETDEETTSLTAGATCGKQVVMYGGGMGSDATENVGQVGMDSIALASQVAERE
jgi:hypothetical protein